MCMRCLLYAGIVEGALMRETVFWPRGPCVFPQVRSRTAERLAGRELHVGALADFPCDQEYSVRTQAPRCLLCMPSCIAGLTCRLCLQVVADTLQVLLGQHVRMSSVELLCKQARLCLHVQPNMYKNYLS